MTTAIVAGATGLTGAALVRLLLSDPRFTSVTAITRRSTGVTHSKFAELLVDFEQPQSWAAMVQADVVFSTLGTTKKQAGSIAAQRKVDFDYQLALANAAASNGVPCFVLLSSMGASSGSFVAYSRMKGELEEAVDALALARLRILRPSFLDGERAEARAGERASILVGRLLARLGIGGNYRPIPVGTVARAMVAAAFDASQRQAIYSGSELFALAESQ